MATTSETTLPPRPPPSPYSPPHPAPTPHSARSTSPLRQSLSPLKRHLSPTKSRSTPARSPARSPSKIFHSVKSVSFTPQRTKQPPRAWERRPATPFVPRDDKQKIWKRVPLGELGVDTNRPMGISRREREAGKDYVRVVKKLKLGHGAGEDADEDKENTSCTAETKVQSEDGDLRRRPSGTSGRHEYVSMRMEDDEIWGSPKKKLRQPPVEQNADINDGGDKDERYKIEDGMEEATNDELYIDDKKSVNITSSQGMVSEGLELPAATLLCDVVADEVKVSHVQHFDAPVGRLPQEVGELQHDTAHSDLIGVVDEAIVDQLQFPVLSVEENVTERHEIVNDAEVSDTSDEQVAMDEEGSAADIGSSSPPTILAENVTIDELAARESPTSSRIQSAIEAETHRQPGEQETPEASQAHPRRISDDEALFLREFMSRTKATKAEQEARNQELQHLTCDEATRMEAEQERATSESHDDPSQVPTLEPSASAEQNDTAPTSPLRRSKRAVVTSIPRPQALPNSIQLKRANGNEFIFKANQASSTANVAMATRSNTKKNKGCALNVPARLEQLLAEKAKEANGDVEQTTDGVAGEIKSKDEKPAKRRKREKNDNGARAKKLLRWNEENLVSYQEAGNNPYWDDIEDSSQENIQAKDNEEAYDHVKLRLTLPPGSSSDVTSEGDKKYELEQAKAQPQQKDQKVRRVRKGVAGTVNGTPAPKTRSKKTIDEDEPTLEVPAEEGPSVKISTAASAALGALATEEPAQSSTAPAGITTSVTRKSRMPVPSSSRRGAGASASARTAGPSLQNKATFAAEGRSQEKTTGAARAQAATKKENEKGDLLGRRRLRVRS